MLALAAGNGGASLIGTVLAGGSTMRCASPWCAATPAVAPVCEHGRGGASLPLRSDDFALDLVDLLAIAAGEWGFKRMEANAKSNGGVSSDTFDQLTALEAENEQLRIALESRIILEQAKGAISVRCGVTPDIAFEMMRGLARSQRRNIDDYAAEIVANGGRLSPRD